MRKRKSRINGLELAIMLIGVNTAYANTASVTSDQ